MQEFLHRIGARLAARRRQAEIHEGLARLPSRALDDLGLTRADIADVARLGARLGPEGAPLGEVVALARASRAATGASPGDRVFAAFKRLAERVGADQAEANLSYTPRELDSYLEEARRLRAQTIAASWRALGRGLGELARPVLHAALESGIGRRVRLELLWHQAYRRLRAELGSYTDRELNADLRLSRSEIDGNAAEGADQQAAEFLARHPGRGHAFGDRAAAGRAFG